MARHEIVVDPRFPALLGELRTARGLSYRDFAGLSAVKDRGLPEAADLRGAFQALRRGELT